MDNQEKTIAEWECTQLVYRFYWSLDNQDYPKLASLFTATGSWNRLGKDLVGPENILAAMTERKNWLTAHLVSNVLIILLDSSRAKTCQYITLYRHEGWAAEDGPAAVVLPLGILRHEDDLVREQGVWKFQRKTSRAVMVDRKRVTHYEKT